MTETGSKEHLKNCWLAEMCNDYQKLKIIFTDIKIFGEKLLKRMEEIYQVIHPSLLGSLTILTWQDISSKAEL